MKYIVVGDDERGLVDCIRVRPFICISKSMILSFLCGAMIEVSKVECNRRESTLLLFPSKALDVPWTYTRSWISIFID